MNNCFVYTHYRKGTKIPFYVGKGSGERHKSKCRRNKHWQYIVKKDNGFDSVISVNNMSHELAYLCESELIDKLKKQGYKLTNMTDGGEGQTGHSVNLGRITTLETKLLLRNANLGKKQSQETIDKRMATFVKIGYVPKPFDAKGVKNCNYKGGYITPNGVFETLEECAIGNNCTTKKVRINLYGNKCVKKGVVYTYPPKDGWTLKNRK